MHLDKPRTVSPLAADGTRYRWYRELNGYHWFVLSVAALGWLFDCLDQHLFNLSRPYAMKSLLAAGSSPDQLKAYAGYATSIFLIGWATGGLLFGVLGDRIGRAKTMLWTILLYSAFTGLSALSVGFWDFAFYRFLTGLGVGGEFAVGVALVAEVMPDRARPFALGLLQALLAVGNGAAALIFIGLGSLEEARRVRRRDDRRQAAASLANHVRHRHHSGIPGDSHSLAAARTRGLAGRGPRRHRRTQARIVLRAVPSSSLAAGCDRGTDPRPRAAFSGCGAWASFRPI